MSFPKLINGSQPPGCGPRNNKKLGHWVGWRPGYLQMCPLYHQKDREIDRKQGLVNVPIKHHPTIGDNNLQQIFRGDIQNPQKGTFTNPWETGIEFDRFRWTNRFEFDRSMEMREIERLQIQTDWHSGMQRLIAMEPLITLWQRHRQRWTHLRSKNTHRIYRSGMIRDKTHIEWWSQKHLNSTLMSWCV